MLFSLLEKLPVDLVGVHVLGCLDLRDIIRRERACGSKASHQLFLNLIPFRPSVASPFCKRRKITSLDWFRKRRCKINYLTVSLPEDNPDLDIKNLQVDYIILTIKSNATQKNCKHFFDINKADLVRNINICGDQNKKLIEQLSHTTRNVKELTVSNADNNNNWLTVDILSRWKLKEIQGFNCASSLMLLIMQTCTYLTRIMLNSSAVDDTVVMAVAQHCPKLETLKLTKCNTITYNSLIALSERGLPLIELHT